jgi:predicted ArsR family transcriptional regulator
VPAPARGRPSGKFTQHRRLDRLREILERHPKGMSLYELADALGVTVRTMRRYLVEIEREYDCSRARRAAAGATLVRVSPAKSRAR